MNQNTLDLTLPRNCLCFNLRKIARLTTQIYTQHLKSVGLEGTQFTLLAALKGKPGINMSELATFLGMDRTTLPRSLKLIEKQGLVNIQVGQDRRQKVLFLSPAGQKKFEEAFPIWREAQQMVIQKLGMDFSGSLIEQLNQATGKL